MEFGDKIRFARQKLGGISTTDLAKMLEISQPYVSKAEKNNQKFGRDVITKLAKLTHLPVEFFTRDEIKSPEELANTPELIKELSKHMRFSKVADAADAAGMTENEVLELIEFIAKAKEKRRD